MSVDMGMEKAKAFLEQCARRNRADAPTESDGGQLAAAETFATKALADLQAKKQALQEAGQHTAEGISVALKDDIAAFEKRANDLMDGIVKPRAAKAQETLANEELPEISDREFQQNQQVLTVFRTLSGADRQLAIARALSGKEEALSRALAYEPSFTSTVSPMVHEQLRAAFFSSETKESIATARDTLQRAKAALVTLNSVAASIRSL